MGLNTIRWTIAGLAAGALTIRLADRVRSAPGRGYPFTFAQCLINDALDRALWRARRQNRLELTSQARYVIFSDHHKGARNDADDFRQCEETYLNALVWYFNQGYTLIVLGDAEELWEEEPEAVVLSYPRVFEAERRFHDDRRYVRIYGNHDGNWRNHREVRKHLQPIYADLRVNEGLLFTVPGGSGPGGEILLVHGHQGTLDSDYFSSPARWIVRNLYRVYQILTARGRTTPAEDPCLRAEHDTQMYRWTSTQPNLILIAGHTHRPVWTSRTHLEQLIDEFWELTENGPAEEIQKLAAQIKERQAKYPPCSDTLKARPSYFNTGCCRFEDGDITGIELAESQIRLVKWAAPPATTGREVLGDMGLSPLFFALSCL